MTQNERIVKWNEDRGLLIPNYDIANEMSFIVEEIIESMTNMKSEEAREHALLISKAIRNGNTKEIVNFIRDKELDIKDDNKVELTKEQIVDGASDIKIFATGLTKKTGYNPDIAMEETIKEIESRKGSMVNGKYVKDKSKEAQSNWYKANYIKALDEEGLRYSIDEFIDNKIYLQLNTPELRDILIDIINKTYGFRIKELIGEYTIICDETNNTTEVIDSNNFSLTIEFYDGRVWNFYYK